MASIADVYFAARLEDDKLQVDAKRAGDKVGQSLVAQIRKSFSGGELGKGLVQGFGLAGALGAANLASSAIHKITDVLGDAVEAAKAEEQSIAKLDTALKENIQSWDGNRDAIERVLKSRMRLGFSDDEQRESLSLLVAATHDVNEALAIQATAMDLARFKGISLQAASEALVKVEAGQYRMLKSLGIQLPKNATAAEALAAAQKVVNGQADAFTRTSGGKMLAAQVRIGEKLEELGKDILPLVADGLSLVVDWVDAAGRGFEKVSSVVGTAIKAYQDFDLAVKLLGSTMTVEEFREIQAAKAAIKAAQDRVAAAQAAFKAEADAARAAGSLALQGGPAFEKLGEAAVTASHNVRRSAHDILTTIQHLRNGATGDAAAAAAALYDPLILAAEMAATQTERLEQKRIIASEKSSDAQIEAAQNRLNELNAIQIEQIGQDITFGTKAQQIAKTNAFLASHFWVQAYDDATPEQAAALDAWRETLQLRVASMAEDARAGGGVVVDNYTGEITDGRPHVAQAADTMVGGAIGPFQAAANDARHWGNKAGDEYAAGLRAKQHAVEQAASKLAGAAGSYLKVSSPAEKGPLSELGGPEGWGERIAKLLSKGLASYLPDLSGALGGAFTPPSVAFAAPNVGASFASTAGIGTAAGAAKVINNNITLEGPTGPIEPFELLDTLRRGQETGLIDTGADR